MSGYELTSQNIPSLTILAGNAFAKMTREPKIMASIFRMSYRRELHVSYKRYEYTTKKGSLATPAGNTGEV
jgi:hypothetical protein